MADDPLRQLRAEGVSLWLDGGQRRQLASGALERFVRELGVSGVWHTPEGLAQLLDGPDYRDRLDELASFGVRGAEAARTLAAYDVRELCEALAEVWRVSRGSEGLVCAPVGHTLGDRSVVAEARVLHWTVDRPNLLVRFPADRVGLAATAVCLGEGIGVALGPVFTQEQYQEVLEAWLCGLEAARAAGLPLSSLPCAVQVPVGQLDTEVQSRLVAPAGPAGPPHHRTGVAVARLLFAAYEQCLDSPRWQALTRAGARPHRLVWATGEVRADRYAGSLVAAGTAHALPGPELERLFGSPLPMSGDTLSGRAATAREDLNRLRALGVDWAELTRALSDAAPRLQYDAWQQLRSAAARAMEQNSR